MAAAEKGQRLIGAVPHGHWKTTTFVAALRLVSFSPRCSGVAFACVSRSATSDATPS